MVGDSLIFVSVNNYPIIEEEINEDKSVYCLGLQLLVKQNKTTLFLSINITQNLSNFFTCTHLLYFLLLRSDAPSPTNL